MYSRTYGKRDLNFEPSGGLIHGALVMNDRETDTYWSMLAGRAYQGPLRGERLRELPGARKMQWSQWLKRHPQTRVLSIRGREDSPYDPYARYFSSKKGFRGIQARDTRLPSKAPVFTLSLKAGRKLAIPFTAIEGGGSFKLGPEHLFVYRPSGVPIFQNSVAFLSRRGFAKRGSVWTELGTGARFDPVKGRFEGGKGAPRAQPGFDTFWVSWSLTNPKTELLGLGAKAPSAKQQPKKAKKRWY